MEKKFSAIQALRFLAAALVIIDHALSDVAKNWPHGEKVVEFAYTLGGTGVVVFFGISGFIMVHTQYESFGSQHSARNFFFRRIIRILPIYSIATFLQFANKFNSSSEYTISKLLESLLFIPYINNGGEYHPVLAQGWTLNYEMFFYIIFSVSLLIDRTKGMAGAIALLFVLSIVKDDGKHEILSFYENSILLYFIAGMIVAVVHRSITTRTHSFWMTITASALLIAASATLKPSASPLSYLIGSLAMVFCCVQLCAMHSTITPNPIESVAERLGDASYSTYLFHTFVLGALKFFSSRIHDHQILLAALFVAFCVVAANATGLLALLGVERPISRRLNVRAHRPSPA